MSRETLEQLRLPIGLVLLAVVAFVLFPRSGDGADETSPAPAVTVGEAGGVLVTPVPTPPATPSTTPQPTPPPTPEPTAEPTPEPTPQPTPAPPPPADDGFTAELLVCRSISGSQCNDEVDNLPPNASSFTALVRFTDANAGDVMNAVLSGPSGTIAGGGYALQGSGDGYYYSTFSAGGLPAGDYVMTATRNGEEVAVTTFRKVGG
jgi:hypothetical protein